MRYEGGHEREPRERPSRRRTLFGRGGISREDRRAMDRFISTRVGVEAYVEPATLHNPLSVVLVATDGEWVRFPLSDQRDLQRLSRRRPVPVYDVKLVGYPKRMKDYRRGRGSD